MSYKRFLTIFTVVVLVSLLLTGQALADKKGDTTRVSVSSSGAQGDEEARPSIAPAISADGRYVAFQSHATNLVANDTNGVEDIFLRDTQTDTTTRISVASDGTQANNESGTDLGISADGRYVTFMSPADNLVADDNNRANDIFLRDTLTNTTVLVSLAYDGQQIKNHSGDPSISTDGRYIVFQTSAGNVVPGGTKSGTHRIYRRDMQTNTIILVSKGWNGTEANRGSFFSSISADGRYITFSSTATNLVPGDTNGQEDVFEYDTQTDTTTLISVNSNGVQANSDSGCPSISANGRYVVFSSRGDNLVSDGGIDGQYDIYVRDTIANTTTLVSKAADGTRGNRGSSYPAISADGRYVTFMSLANNLVKGDTNGLDDIFWRDLATETIERTSVASNGAQANANSSFPSISADGLYVVFHSEASNLVHDDTNGVNDIFVREIGEKPSPKPTHTPKPELLPATGFAPGRITTLSPSTAEIYSNLSMRLAIPTLKLNAAIVSVPKKGVNSWNVSGLGGNIGYLSGTVFPAQKGNAVLTGHLYGSNGQPGPFINLEKMTRGQQIIIHANGRQYVYVVFAVKKWVDPSTTGFLANHESHPWLTLITCSGYDAKTNSYRWRTVVRATLVKTLNKP